MKHIIKKIGMFSAFFMLMIKEVIGQPGTPAKMSSTTQPSNKIEGMKPLEKGQAQPKASSRPSQSIPVVRMPPPIPQQADYFHPGILVFLNGKWEGSDHLLNLSQNIGVNISIVKPENEVLEVSEAQLQKEVVNIFAQANIKPQALAVFGKPPLPYFQIEVFIFPIEKGYTAYCEGRLFESVTLDRFKMDPNMAFQAITWEKQHLIVSPNAQFEEQLTKTVQDIASSFAERFQNYERLKKSL